MTLPQDFPRRLTKIDDLSRPDHTYLTAEDECLFFGEYSARKGFAYSSTNDVVLNFKKEPKYRGKAPWRYKEAAIRDVGAAFGAALPSWFLSDACLVPVPPSKAPDHPDFDDRMIRMLQAIPGASDIREVVRQSASWEASHEKARDRAGPDELCERYSLDEKLCRGAPRCIGVFDDLITTGSHFVAVQRVLRERFPEARVIGLFIARRVPEAMDVEDVFSGFDDES